MTPADFRAWLERHGLTQAQAAKLLGVRAGQHRISEWAGGKRPLPRYIARHCDTLDRLSACEQRETHEEEREP